MSTTGDRIIEALLSEYDVYLHYTSEAGLAGITHDGVIRPNSKFAVYLTKEPMKAHEAAHKLFIGATTHEGRATHVIAFRMASGVPIEPCGYYEFCVRQSLRLDQHDVIYKGPNPF